MTIILGIALSSILALQIAARPNVRLPDEAAGLDAMVRTLIDAFDQVDVIALGEAHDRKVDSDLRIALVRHPEFAKRVRTVVIECGSTSEQPTLDRYIRGEAMSRAQLERVWKTTTQSPNGLCEAPVYMDFLAAVREVNAPLRVDARIRVLGGDPGPGDNRSREAAAVSVLKEPVLQKLQRLPFRDFTAEEFLGRSLTTCRGAGGCRSVFKGSTLTLGQMADACVYVGRDPDADRH